MDHLKALEVFCAVAEAKGLAGGARKLSLSPPSVTRIINELEAHLGTPLLHRTTRTVSLTQVGLTYFVDAKRILDDLKLADDTAKGAQIKPTGTLRITSSVLFGQYYMGPIILDYLNLYPDVRVEAVFIDRLVNVVEEGFDIAVRIGKLPDSSLRAKRVGAVRHVVCGSPDYFNSRGIPQHPRDLQQHKIIHFTGFSGDAKWNFDGKTSVQLKPRLTFSSVAPCISSAKASWGLTKVLSYQIGPSLGDGDLQTVLTDYTQEQWPINLVYADGRIQSAKVRSFLDLAAEKLQNDRNLN